MSMPDEQMCSLKVGFLSQHPARPMPDMLIMAQHDMKMAGCSHIHGHLSASLALTLQELCKQGCLVCCGLEAAWPPMPRQHMPDVQILQLAHALDLLGDRVPVVPACARCQSHRNSCESDFQELYA